MILYMYTAPGQELTTPWDKIWMSTRTSCHFGHLLQISKKSLWSLILYNFFHDFIHVYSPRAGADSPQGTKFWCQQTGLITLPIYYKFQRNLFEVWFYTFFFSWYSPQGTKFRCQQKLHVTLVILLLVLNHRRQQFLKNPLFYLFPIQKHKGPKFDLAVK